MATAKSQLDFAKEDVAKELPHARERLVEAEKNMLYYQKAVKALEQAETCDHNFEVLFSGEVNCDRCSKCGFRYYS